MRVALLYNDDGAARQEDPGRAARVDVRNVAVAVHRALLAQGHQIVAVGLGSRMRRLPPQVLRHRPEVVVNLCESIAGDSRGEILVPLLLELEGIPYTGSGPLALALALHKGKAKEVLRGCGIATPRFRVFGPGDAMVSFVGPMIVKPIQEDASVGIDFDSVLRGRAAMERAVRTVHANHHQPALVEAFIEGREISVPFLGNAPPRALPMREIHFEGEAFANRPKIVTYDAKWTTGSAAYRGSRARLAELPKVLERRCAAVAAKAFEALGCRDYGRVDLRIDADGIPWVIDVNPNCDLHPSAGFAQSARAAGINYRALISHLLRTVRRRWKYEKPEQPMSSPSH